MREVEVGPVPLDRLTALLTPQRAALLRDVAVRAEPMLADRIVWNVNATARGGGVAEMLQTLLAYGRGAGVDTRWLVLDGDPEFFAITKRLHNVLHGEVGDGGPLGSAERDHYVRVLQANLARVSTRVRAGDIVLLHDPQTAGLVDGLRDLGLHVVWRCHIGRDTGNDLTDLGWSFLRGFIEDADGFIFSREVYTPSWVPAEKLWVIPPSIDPFSVKNRSLQADETLAVLKRVSLVDTAYDGEDLTFFRRDGDAGLLRPHTDLLVDGAPPPVDARLVVQVSRWDRLKDMGGVMAGFAANVDRLPSDAHLMLVGPEVAGVADDPEGAEVLNECRAHWQHLSPDVRRRIHLVALPMDDVDENAHIVNAVQQHAAVVVQKSLVEGFGLTVTEAMWKGRPVVASAVGGIQDQIMDRKDGLLLEDPRDLDALAEALDRVLSDEVLAASLGAAARARVQDQFLGDRHLIQYVDLFESLLS
ncbi:MAG TPA: glycosyltransferase [Nocardioidaceae bacterium]|nr:glycosyltransferase [Nocardioidaceae bacterium]